jgi:hypothetical protein
MSDAGELVGYDIISIGQKMNLYNWPGAVWVFAEANPVQCAGNPVNNPITFIQSGSYYLFRVKEFCPSNGSAPIVNPLKSIT